jgi:hypothetical protein
VAADRVQTLEKAFPAIDDIFHSYAADKQIPGMVWGIVIDNRLAHVGTFGVQDLRASAQPLLCPPSRTRLPRPLRIAIFPFRD